MKAQRLSITKKGYDDWIQAHSDRQRTQLEVQSEPFPQQNIPITEHFGRMELAQQQLRQIDQQRARIVQQMYGLAHTIAANLPAGKAAMSITPTCHCPGGGCI